MRTLIKNITLYITTSIVTQALVFILWIMLSHWLSPKEIGLYALVTFLIELFSMLAIAGLDSGITRFYHTANDRIRSRSTAIFLLIISTILAITIFSTATKFIIPSVIPSLSDFLRHHQTLIASLIVVNTAFNFILAHYAAEEKAPMYAKFNLLKISVFTILAVLLVRIGAFGIEGILYALGFSSIFIVSIFILIEKKAFTIHSITPLFIPSLLRYCTPLMLYGIISVVITYLSRILLDKYSDLATLGVYSFFLTLVLQINGLWGSFNRAWTPAMFIRLNDNKRRAMEQTTLMVFISICTYLTVTIVSIIIGKVFLFNFIFRDEYIANIHILYILILAPLFTGIYTVCYPLFYYHNKTHKILTTFIVASLINVSITIGAVRYYGQNGAALVFLLTIILNTCIYLLAFQEAMDIPKKIIIWTGALSAILIASSIMLINLKSTWGFLTVLIICTILSYKVGRLNPKKLLLRTVAMLIYDKYKSQHVAK